MINVYYYNIYLDNACSKRDLHLGYNMHAHNASHTIAACVRCQRLPKHEVVPALAAVVRMFSLSGFGKCALVKPRQV